MKPKFWAWDKLAEQMIPWSKWNQHNTFQFLNSDNFIISWLGHYCDSSTIIGNIYENAELIEQ